MNALATYPGPAGAPQQQQQTTSDRLATLTRREREVLALIAAGASNEGIRDALVVSPKTVETHVTSIFTKLGVRRGARTHPRVMAARMWLSPRALN